MPTTTASISPSEAPSEGNQAALVEKAVEYWFKKKTVIDTAVQAIKSLSKDRAEHPTKMKEAAIACCAIEQSFRSAGLFEVSEEEVIAELEREREREKGSGKRGISSSHSSTSNTNNNNNNNNNNHGNSNSHSSNSSSAGSEVERGRTADQIRTELTAKRKVRTILV